MLTLPGLIDPHVHVRGLSTDSYKEDFYTCTQAALAGGYTTIFDMPNNPQTPTLTYELLQEKQAIAKTQILCDVGFFFGTDGKNFTEFKRAEQGSSGLKVFLNQSTGNFCINFTTFAKVCESWTTALPILLHAEEDIIPKALEITHAAGQHAHICHVSSARELQYIITAKEKGIHVTCGVTPHHLFLTSADEKKLGTYGLMKPRLKTQSDVDFLWKYMDAIDVIESDHAPHSKKEKESSHPPFGVTGLETTLGLLLTAAHEGKITREEIQRLCYENPKKIFLNALQYSDEKTFITVDENEVWTVNQEKLFTKAKTTPFHSWKLRGRVKQVSIRGVKVFENTQILVKPGFGRILKPLV